MAAISIAERIIGKEVNQAQLEMHVSNYHISEIARDVEDWEELAPYLEISNTALREIKEKYSDQYYFQKCMALETWRSNTRGKTTYKALIEIFCSEGKVQLAEAVIRIIRNTEHHICNCFNIDKFYRYLLEWYLNTSHPAMKHEPHASNRYIDLLFYEAHPCATTKPGSVNSVPNTKKFNEIFYKTGERMIVMFEGLAGSGKTTLCWHICREWAAKRLLQKFHLLLYIKLNDPDLISGISLCDFIPHHESKPFREEIASTILTFKGKGVCLLLDGLDEASPTLMNTIYDLIVDKQAVLPHLSFIMTARPDKTVSMYMNPILQSKVVIGGFSTAKLDEFMDDCFETLASTKEVVHHIFATHPEVKELCTLPVNAVIMAYLVHSHKNNLPQSKGGLFQMIVSNFLMRHIRVRLQADRLDIPYVSKLTDPLPLVQIREYFEQLCSVAYTATIKKKHCFTSVEVNIPCQGIDNALGLLQVVLAADMEPHYSFSLQSLRIFLAAIYICINKEHDNSDIPNNVLEFKQQLYSE